jgi:hypothetical protein
MSDALAGQQPLLDLIWPQGAASPSTWAVFDCARDPAIYRMLLGSRLELRCLYSGTVPRELEVVAPHLVELPPGHRLARQWIDEGLCRSWGVVLRTSDPANLRHQLRKLLKVHGPDGRKLLFRWYDPRVLRAFLPTADAVQLAAFFGDITAWICEDEGDNVLEFRRDVRGTLHCRRVGAKQAA